MNAQGQLDIGHYMIYYDFRKLMEVQMLLSIVTSGLSFGFAAGITSGNWIVGVFVAGGTWSGLGLICGMLERIEKLSKP